MGFFSDLNEDIGNALKNIREISDKAKNDVQEAEKYEIIVTIMESIANSPSWWDSYCLFNIYKQGERFSKYIKTIGIDVSYLNDVRKDILFEMCIRFFVELHFTISSHHQDFHPLSKLDGLIHDLKSKAFYSDGLTNNAVLRYAFYEMPIHILNFYMRQEGFKVFFSFNERKAELDNKLREYNEGLREKLETVELLNKKLEEQKTAFNFVGLSKGFENILDKKENAKWLTFGALVVMLCITLVPLGFSFWKFIHGEELMWQKMLPVIGLEFILIYFFRVVLNHYNSIQTQIMQLELRQSLCQFIQSYAEYAKEIKSNDRASLEKFENLIFSSILSNPDKVPGTFDGIESVTALVKELRGSK